MKYVDAGLEAVQQVLQEDYYDVTDSISFSKVHKTHNPHKQNVRTTHDPEDILNSGLAGSGPRPAVG